MAKVPNISDAEWEVMKIFWSKSFPCSANEVVHELAAMVDWKPNTVKTLISRLVKKKVLGYKEDGRAHLYYPLISEEECVKAESRSFLKRVYGGALKPMLVNFLQDEKLTAEDIEELKHLLNGRQD